MKVQQFVEQVVYVYDCERAAAGGARSAVVGALMYHRYLLHTAPDGSSSEMTAGLTVIENAG